MYVSEIGKRLTVTAATEAKARKALQEKVRLVKDGKELARNASQTFGEYAEHVISTRSLSDRTRDLYRAQVRLYCQPIREVKLDKIESGELARLYRDIQAGCTWDERGRRQPGKRERKVRVAQIVHVVIRLVLNQAVKHDLLAKNPADAPGVRPEPVKGGQAGHVKAFNEAQAARILGACGKVTHGAVIAFLLLTGMRRGEAVALKWENVDFQRRLVQIRATRSPSDGKIMEAEPKTARSRRDVPLMPEAVELLKGLYEQRGRPKRSALKGYVFLSGAGTPLLPRSVNVALTQCLDLLDREQGEDGEAVEPMPRLPVHALRHSFVSLMAAQGQRKEVIAEWIGDSYDTVSKVYLHVFKEHTAMPSLKIGSFQVKR